jgi:hypothetical protein
VRGVITARGPDQEDNFALPHAQALQPKFTVAFAIIFHRDHRVIEDGFQFRKINLVMFSRRFGSSQLIMFRT